MGIGNVSQAIAAQAEYLRPNLEMLALLSSVLWKRMSVRTDVKAVSNRPARIPFQPLTGGLFRVGSFDGADMGLGSGPTEAPGSLSCVGFLQASQYTALAEWSTDSSEKAIADYVKLTNDQASATFGGYMDANIANGDGSNTLDTVVSTVSGGIVVNNANSFQDNQIVDIWTAIGGSLQATVQINSVDIANNTIWLTAAVPGGVTAGQPILVAGSSGQANSGLFGLRYYNVAGNAGNFMGIQRSSFPGKFSTPNINLGGKSLTPAVVRALQAQMILALGQDRVDTADNCAHCNVDAQAAWENNALLVQSVVANQVKGDEATDMLKPNAPTQIAGRPVLVNPRAKPGYIDFLSLKNWWRIETKATDMYEVGGQTIFPAYGSSGGLQSSNLFYMVVMTQIGTGQPRLNSYVNNFAIPSGYFGH
jgi:hypothetical protein